MAKNHIDRAALIAAVRELKELSNEQKADILQLISEQKKYGLVWEDSPEEAEDVLRTNIPVLKEVKDKFIPADGEGSPNHILIEGENLQALNALVYLLEGMVDVIYIDPPYNTGNKDFVYNDSFVDSEDGYRHSKWLSFMEKRLRIAKKLLSDKGVIFISIDDNEQANLKLLCDEVFGSYNYIANFIKPLAGGKAPHFVKRCHEYLLCYMTNQFNIVEALKNRCEIQEKATSRSLRKDGDADRRQDRPDMYYCIYADIKNQTMSLTPFENSEAIYPIRPDGTDGRWRWGKEKFSKENDKLILKKKKNGKYDVCVKTEEGIIREYPWESIIRENTGAGGVSLNNILGENSFSYPKNVDYIVWVLSTIKKDNATILDFFAGSGTTLHATMQLNAEDGGHRQCILVTNNENNICEEVTYERNKRVIEGYTTPKGVKVEGLHNNNLRYYKMDFVPRENIAPNRMALMEAATDMLCIKEGCYTELRNLGKLELRKKYVRYFAESKTEDGKAHGKQMLIVYEPEAVQYITKELREDNTIATKEHPLHIFVYSDGGYAYQDEFEGLLDVVELTAMPDALMQSLRNVLPEQNIDDETFDTEEGGQDND